MKELDFDWALQFVVGKLWMTAFLSAEAVPAPAPNKFGPLMHLPPHRGRLGGAPFTVILGLVPRTHLSVLLDVHALAAAVRRCPLGAEPLVAGSSA